MTNLKRLLVIGMMGSSIGLSGCASMTSELAAAGVVEVETTDSQNAHITLAQISVIDEFNIEVSGYLEKRYQPRGRIPGHLRIQAVSAAGEVVADVVSSYHRRRANSRRAFFAQALHVPVSQLSAVNVTHYGLGSHDH